MQVRNIILITLVLMLIFVLGFVAGGFYVYDQTPTTLYQVEDSRKELNLDFEPENGEILNSQNEKLDTMYYDNPDSSIVVLYLHGNTGRTDRLMNRMVEIADVYSPSYPGYGSSEGEPNEDGIYEVVGLSIDDLQSKGYKTNEIIIYGHSIGGSPAVYGSTMYGNRVKATVLVNTFDSIQARCAEDYYILCFLLFDFHNSKSQAEDMQGKVVQFHNPNDESVNYERGENLSKEIDKHVADYEFKNIGGKHSDFDVAETLEGLLD